MRISTCVHLLTPTLTCSVALSAQYLFYNHPTLVGLFLLTSVMGVVLTGFTCYHLYLVSINVTTNETFKWSTLTRKVEYVTQQNEVSQCD